MTGAFEKEESYHKSKTKGNEVKAKGNKGCPNKNELGVKSTKRKDPREKLPRS